MNLRDQIFLSTKCRLLVLLFLLAASCLNVYSQAWSSFLDSSRAINWSTAGFTIPSYSTNCSVQPALTANSTSAASANTTAIQNALNSCDSTHNVVNIPSGTYYIAGVTFPAHGLQVLRGAGPKVTKLIPTTDVGCSGLGAGICYIGSNYEYDGAPDVLPSSGSNQCSWTAGYAQGTTSLTFSNCGGAPPVNHLIILDQANDSSDTGGVYVCNENTPASCNYDGTGGAVGRVISGKSHSQIQTAYVTAVTSLGGGSYTVTISPGVYFTNIRSSQTPGAWWSSGTTLNGLENMTVDGTSVSNATLLMYDCYHCWAKNVAFLNSDRASIQLYQSGFGVIRDSYFYQAQGHTQISYNIDFELTSGFLVENNIMQQVTTPITINDGSGNVIDYNLGIDSIAFSGYTWPAFVSHDAGNSFNLWEGNVWAGMQSDDAWGSPSQQTYFRNLLAGWSNQGTNGTIPIIHRSYTRVFNIVGNVLGQPGYHTQYQAIATGNTTATGDASENTSIYSLGLAGNYSPAGCGTGAVTSSPYCDALTVSTLMRWGNYDVVTAGIKWDSTEASPAAVTYVNANFSSSYFSSLAHTLPASLYYNSAPSWWPSGKAWPAIGPDVSSGNVGVCTGGTYAGAEATSAVQCSGGSLTAAWASHATSIPAQDCFLITMGGKPDGSGSALTFDANSCYTQSTGTGNTQPNNPTALSGTAVLQ